MDAQNTKNLRFDPELNREGPGVTLHEVALQPAPAGMAAVPIHLQHSWNWCIKPSSLSQLSLSALPTLLATLAGVCRRGS